MKSRAKVGSNTDSKKVVAIIVAIIIMIAAAIFFFGRKTNNEEDIPSNQTWIVDDTDPADEIERIKKLARKSRPAAGVYSEEFGALPNTSEAEADSLLAEGALAPEAVGDLASKEYNQYSLEKDLELAGPEQPQEVVSEDEVQQLIEETVEELPDPTPTPTPATPENPVIVDRTEDLPDPNDSAEEARRAEEEARRAAEEEAARLAAEEEARKADEEAQRKYDELVNGCVSDGGRWDPTSNSCLYKVDVETEVSFD